MNEVDTELTDILLSISHPSSHLTKNLLISQAQLLPLCTSILFEFILLILILLLAVLAASVAESLSLSFA